MIWHPGALALLVGSGAAVLVTLLALPFAVRIVLRWDAGASSEGQFALERATHLVSALAAFAIAVEAASLFLFVAVANDMSRFLVGAMCATGTLAASSIGWWSLWLKMFLVLAGWLWLAINSLDNRSPGYPLIRVKYKFLLLLIPFFALDFALLVFYFSGIDPDVITSCCGSLFSTASAKAGGVVADYHPKELMQLHSAGVAFAWATGLAALVTGRRTALAAASIAAALFLPLALASVISFVAPYVYGLPWHHCPFDMFQAGHNYVGFPLFASLFAATAWGVLPVVVLPFASRPGMETLYPQVVKRWMVLSLASRGIFDILVYYPVFGGGLSLY